ncbi:MAG: hypothetical protein NC926_01975 [Candidatus Omnitrophica bacterium]|nr:hypothetical protein [Candidatus Omnitrophota bacterium]MCM8806715.1 hypothetical protein [Candidatus Omnitrophota bacterium]
MAFTEEEKSRIIEEEKIRLKVRLKYEQKSSGLAGVLSTICPGLGQIYNGQFGKGTFIGLTVLIGIVLLSLGITFQLKGTPSKGGKIEIIEQEKEVQMTEEGIVIEENSEKEKSKETPVKTSQSKLPYILMIVGILGICCGWSYGVKDAIKTAKRLNEESLKDL